MRTIFKILNIFVIFFLISVTLVSSVSAASSRSVDKQSSSSAATPSEHISKQTASSTRTNSGIMSKGTAFTIVGDTAVGIFGGLSAPYIAAGIAIDLSFGKLMDYIYYKTVGNVGVTDPYLSWTPGIGSWFANVQEVQ